MRRDQSSPVLLALHAMATRFELVLHGDDPVRLRAAGEEALAEIERLERLLSFYLPDSEITAINRGAADAPVRVSGEVFRLLRACVDVHGACGGAFDITIGPLMRAWKFAGAGGGLPDREALEAARAVTGLALVELDDDARTVYFVRPGVAIDLGAGGKGFAVDVAIDVLRDLGVSSALLHGGTSSVHALGAPPGEDGWRVALQGLRGARARGLKGSRARGPQGSRAPGLEGSRAPGLEGSRARGLQDPRARGLQGSRARGLQGSGARGLEGSGEKNAPDERVLTLRDSALSVSAAHGKAFEHEGRVYGHVIDPRIGEPVAHTHAAGVTGPSSFLCDALSTALMVNGADWLPTLRERWPGYGGWAVGTAVRR